MERIPSERLLKTVVLQKVFYKQKLFKKSSIHRKLLKGRLWTKALQKVLFEQKPFSIYPVDRSPSLVRGPSIA